MNSLELGALRILARYGPIAPRAFSMRLWPTSRPPEERALRFLRGMEKQGWAEGGVLVPAGGRVMDCWKLTDAGVARLAVADELGRR